MANRNFPSNKLYNMHVMEVQLDGQISIAGSGAPSAPTLATAPGLKSITRLAAGLYVIQLQDNYAKALVSDIQMQSPAPGGNVTAGSFVTGTPYVITALGTTNFRLVGVPADVTPAAGIVFVASGAGTGTGTAKAITNSGILKCEQMGVIENSTNPTANQGARIYVQCLGATAVDDVTLIPKDPVNGSVMQIRLLLNNSSVQ